MVTTQSFMNNNYMVHKFLSKGWFIFERS